METEKIKEIKTLVDNVSSALNNFELSEHKGHKYGSENEYTPTSLKAGIKGLMNDLRVLVKAHDKFVRISVYSERKQIADKLGEIKDFLSSGEYRSAADTLDELKIIIRPYRVRGSKESQNVIEERINKLTGMTSELEEHIEKARRIKSEAENINSILQEAKQAVDDLPNQIADISNKLSQAEELQERAETSKNEVEEILNAAKSDQGSIKSIVQELGERQNQTKRYKEDLTSGLKDAEKLINEARSALGYSTAKGISAAFDERYDEGKQEKKYRGWWLAGSVVFVGGAVAIGVWWTFFSDDISSTMIISRITLMLTSLSGAWFCAAQYVKNKNILEDYGYKSVLAKSMVGFLSQFENEKEERELYLKTVLREIHQDPLRKRHDLDDIPAQSVARKLKKDRGKSSVDAAPDEDT